MPPADLGRVHGTGVQYEAPPDLNRVPEFDQRAGDHYWIVPVAFKTDPATWRAGEQVHLDAENLVAVSGAGCYYCERPYSQREATRRCKGRP
ncbi:MAG: hypothetical protein ACRDT2_10135 [Natronosporangium sp.]